MPDTPTPPLHPGSSEVCVRTKAEALAMAKGRNDGRRIGGYTGSSVSAASVTRLQSKSERRGRSRRQRGGTETVVEKEASERPVVGSRFGEDFGSVKQKVGKRQLGSSSRVDRRHVRIEIYQRNRQIQNVSHGEGRRKSRSGAPRHINVIKECPVVRNNHVVML
jgi:hypothetical protein